MSGKNEVIDYLFGTKFLRQYRIIWQERILKKLGSDEGSFLREYFVYFKKK